MQTSFFLSILLATSIGLMAVTVPPTDPSEDSRYENPSKYRGRKFIFSNVHGSNSANKETLRKTIAGKKTVQLSLGQTRQFRQVEAWYFPGTSDKNALVIGGVHGSELSSIEVARTLIRQLQESNNSYYNVIVIPSLFPDNALAACHAPEHIGSPANIGRYSYAQAVDPNRQMPSPGKAYNEEMAIDHCGREVELENQLLLELIQTFRPERIMNIHAIRNTKFGGIYADPRTDHNGIALGYASDSSLAVSIASFIYERGGNVSGNNLATKPTALYYKDPLPAPAGSFQPRNMKGSVLKADRGSGVSLGTWASTAVYDDTNPAANRDAISIITMEYPGCKRPADYRSKAEQAFQQQQVNNFAKSVAIIFLGNNNTQE
jgi:hypothetical protein